MSRDIRNVIATINYIERHLQDKLDLEIIANGVHYSKYHIHRIFTNTVGLTIQIYVQRRRLTEAAKLLVFSDKPILEIALVDGFPHLNEKEYPDKLQEYINNRRALILKDADTAIGVMAFNEMTGSIDFLGVHPQYRKRGIAKAFCEKVLYEISCSSAISITTFREGDKADTGYREALKNIGFAEAELLVEFSYPTQRLILR